MGIKKIARPMNKAKNEFVKWLKSNESEGVSVFEGEDDGSWDYYRSVSGFVGEILYTVEFMVWGGRNKINYRDGENRYENLSIDEFMELIR